MSIPAHKSGTAGQIVNNEELDKMSYKSRPKTLGDVIDNVLASEAVLQKKRLTFEEWEATQDFEFTSALEVAQAAWKAAQENV